MNNQAGSITLDFVFALVISFGMAAILFAMTFTLTVVEVAQYITFSAARAQVGANVTPQDQEESARKKYDLLMKNPILSPLFKKDGWFEISDSKNIEVRGGVANNGSFGADYPSGEERKVFMGVRTKFNAKVLELKFPLIGSTADEEDGFTTRIVSLLIREPSQQECQDFIKARLQNINQLNTARYGAFAKKEDFFPMEDNGC